MDFVRSDRFILPTRANGQEHLSSFPPFPLTQFEKHACEWIINSECPSNVQHIIFKVCENTYRGTALTFGFRFLSFFTGASRVTVSFFLRAKNVRFLHWWLQNGWNKFRRQSMTLVSIQYRNPVVLFPGCRFVCWILSLCLKQWGLIN